MAGDHKCPVCQATFTRPQHVARHMRSHTGDRPYKCQHCGDQFARSDLLSRHVNKCHAGDKPPTTTAPTRRKGQHGSSSTRATTSKQACDQCVMATLPCDGAFPCSKCVGRKSECTYVKFQRQTAPAGPGHKHTQSLESTSSTSSGMSLPRADELFLVPANMSVPSMGPSSDQYYANPHPQFAFNASPHGQAWDDSPNPPSLSLSVGEDSPMASRYRAQDEMLRRSYPGSSGPANVAPGLYGSSSQSGSSDQWQLSEDYALSPQRQFEALKQREKYPDVAYGSSVPNAQGFQQSGVEFNGGGLYSLHARRGSIDGFSDGGSGASAGDSTTSSSVHLPLDLAHTGEQRPQQIPLDFDSYAMPFSDAGQQPPPSQDGRFSSAFGHLSLVEDRQMLGQYNNSEGSAPFFTGAAMKRPPSDSTPRPYREEDYAGNSSRDREAEMQELREFWKQYLRTPLTGPSLGQTPRAEFLNRQLGDSTNNLNGRPTPKRVLSRVASLPTVRTPAEEKPAPTLSRTGLPQVAQTPGVRVHTTDDLKSYEQAVLARKAPTNLSIGPRKSRLSQSVSPNQSPSPGQLHVQMNGQIGQGVFLDPGPRSGRSSRLSTDGGHSSDEPNRSPGRPSFKRLPSQTLENTVQKRALFRWGQGEETMDDTDSEADGPASVGSNAAYRNLPVQLPDTFLERYRRQSAPSGDANGEAERQAFIYNNNTSGRDTTSVHIG